MNTKVKSKASLKLEEMSREQIKLALLKKKECNAVAQRIVETLLEPDVSERLLLKCLPDINQSHFQDIIEERAIVMHCGYPLCNNSLTNDIPKQRYKISIKNNKVYDITDRKNFCSNKCYNAATFLKKQLLTSPLWFREYEQIPEFKLLPEHISGCLGQEVPLFKTDKVDINEEQESQPVGEYKQNRKKCINEPDISLEKSSVATVRVTDEANEPTDVGDKRQELSTGKTGPTGSSKVKQPTHLNILGEVIEKSTKLSSSALDNNKQSSVLVKPNTTLSQKLTINVIVAQVEKCLEEWFTLDSVIYLYGKDKVREMVLEQGESVQQYLNKLHQGQLHSATTYDQYQQLCRKLNLLEMEENKFDKNAFKKETKPLPDYSVIKGESDRINIKVHEDLTGESEYCEPVTSEGSGPPDDGSNLTRLPLVDKNSQNALRRKIVMNQLIKALEEVLRCAGAPVAAGSAVRELVATFRLRPHNVTLRPRHWLLVAIVALRALCMSARPPPPALQHPRALRHLDLLLLTFNLDMQRVTLMLHRLTDVSRLLPTGVSTADRSSL